MFCFAFVSHDGTDFWAEVYKKWEYLKEPLKEFYYQREDIAYNGNMKQEDLTYTGDLDQKDLSKEMLSKLE